MADHAQLVAIGVAKIRTVIIGMVLRAQSRRLFAGASVREGAGIRRTYGFAAGRKKGKHLSIARTMRFLVEGATDQEERSRIAASSRSWLALRSRSKLNRWACDGAHEISRSFPARPAYSRRV